MFNSSHAHDAEQGDSQGGVLTQVGLSVAFARTIMRARKYNKTAILLLVIMQE